MSDNFSRRQIIKAAGGLIVGAASAGSVPLISNLIAGFTLIEPAHAQARPPRDCDGFVRSRFPVTTPSGRPFRLKCLGTGSGDYRFLNGVTRGGNVNLVLNTQYYSGTAWGADEYRDSSGLYIYTFKCRGNDQGSGTVSWLNGKTLDREVDLVRNTSPSGAKWAAYNRPGTDEWKFYCLGDRSGPRWLNGITFRTDRDNNVDLADGCSFPYTGTTWRRQ
ncbi:hypothetical protein FNW02_17985 [Komarekiella sp. 'clone 1']|uniref:Uncharacterized protein n=1 Tax=Komarekiella delphini-convector SJRDD-AB1 TaxID=2593771 RepID=A0AA40SYJ4_9NOST|nr:hypothetical protein [Komarekiella delphini-convector]MBD6617666.1 hypothetical protein [Komarekiella delphini-convector SJRDD-AB1]